MTERFYCPTCGEREVMGQRCSCGLLWNEARLSMPHYARRRADKLAGLISAETERARYHAARALTAHLLKEGGGNG